jgi:hypothetical protein
MTRDEIIKDREFLRWFGTPNPRLQGSHAKIFQCKCGEVAVTIGEIYHYWQLHVNAEVKLIEKLMGLESVK